MSTGDESCILIMVLVMRISAAGRNSLICTLVICELLFDLFDCFIVAHGIFVATCRIFIAACGLLAATCELMWDPVP